MAITREEVLRIIRVRQISEGANEALSDLTKLREAHGALAVQSEVSAQRQTAVSRAFEQVRRSNDPAYRQLQTYLEQMRRLNLALEQNDTLQNRQAANFAQQAAAQSVLIQPAVQGVAAMNRQFDVEQAARLKEEQRAIAIVTERIAQNEKKVADEFWRAAEAAQKIRQEQQAARQVMQAADTQARVNAAMGIGTAPGRSARDSAAFFEENARAAEKFEARLAALRAQADPIAASQDRLNAEILEFKTLLDSGNLSLTEHTSLVNQAQARHNALAATMDGLSTGTRVAGYQVTNLGYQLNDIAVQMSMPGANPASIIMQQGLQIGQIWQELSPAVRGMDAFRMAMAQLLNPFNRFVIVAAAASYAVMKLYQYFNDEGPKAEDIIDRQTEAIKRLNDALRITTEGFDPMQGSIAAAEASQRASAEATIKRMQVEFERVQEAALAPGSLGIVESILPLSMTRTGVQMGEIRDDLEAFYETARDGNPDFETLINALSEAELNPYVDDQVQALARRLREAAEDAANMQRTLERTSIGRQGQPILGAQIMDQTAATNRFDTEAARTEALLVRQEAARNLITRAIELQNVGQDLGLSQTRELLASQRSAVEEADKITHAINTQISATERLRLEEQLEYDARRAVGNPALQAEIERRRALVASMGEEQTSAQSAQEQGMAYRDTLDSIVYAEERAALERTRAMDAQIRNSNMEIELIGKTAAEQERLRIQFQLTEEANEAAFQTGIAPTNAYLENIRQTADEMARLAEEMAKVQAVDDLLFERAQLGRTSGEQEVASLLRSAGLSEGSDAGRMVAETERLNQSLELTRDLADGALRGLISDLREGATGMEILSNQMNNFADRMADLVADQALSFFMSAIIGGATGGVNPGGAYASMPLLFGSRMHSGGEAGRDGELVMMTEHMLRQAERFHRGSRGVGLGVNEIPAILERGERVMRADNSGGGSMVMEINVRGARGNTEIEQMVAQGVETGIRGFESERGPRMVRSTMSEVRRRSIHYRGG
jgi:hypothetical protein